MIINLSRDEFIDYMKVLEDYFWHTKRLADEFGHEDLYGTTLMDVSVGMLAEPFEDIMVEDADTGEMNLLTYFCWVMEFGKSGQKVQIDGQTYDVATAGDLYDLLIQIEEKRMIETIKDIKGTITVYGCDSTDTIKLSGCYMD